MRTPDKPPGHLHLLNPNARAFESGMGAFATPGSLCKHYADTVPAKVHPQAPATLLVVGGKGKPPKPPTSTHPLGVKVHSKSMIDAETWVKMIGNCKPVPAHFKKYIKKKGDILCIPTDFREPEGDKRDWFEDWKKAFSADKWECTTGNLRITVKKPKPPPQGKGKTPPPKPKKAIRSMMEPDTGEADQLIEPLFEDTEKDPMKHEYETPYDKNFGVHLGLTIDAPTHLEDSDREGIIIITTRVTLKLGDAPEEVIKCLPDEVVRTWFHELACHAGRHSAGREIYDHAKDGQLPNDVDKIEDEIDDMIKGKATYNLIKSKIQGYWSADL